MIEGSETRKRGLTFDDFVAYKARCLDPKTKLEPDHYFYNFDLKSHNANAEQVENVAERKRIESASKSNGKLEAFLVTRVKTS